MNLDLTDLFESEESKNLIEKDVNNFNFLLSRANESCINMLTLSIYYYYGIGCVKNKDLAIEWCMKSKKYQNTLTFAFINYYGCKKKKTNFTFKKIHFNF